MAKSKREQRERRKVHIRKSVHGTAEKPRFLYSKATDISMLE
jgi:ribosomal protein L18